MHFEGVTAVLFDCDGVLLDSEPLSEAAWRATLEGLGVELEDFSEWIGRTDLALATHYGAELEMSPSRLNRMAADQFLELVAADGVPRFPDGLAALDRGTRSGLPTGVVSNSERWRLDALLQAAGIQDRFDVELTSDDVPHPKPAPDIYLRAADLLGVAADRCVVLEDSPTGITAARAAGMRVVAVDRGVFEPAALSHATLVVTDLTTVL